MIRIKEGVNLAGLRPEMLLAINAAEGVWGKAPVTVTSALDGKHGRGSLHYVGLAVDLRTRDIMAPEAKALSLGKELGAQYDVVLESNHIHVEFQPK